MAFDWEDYLSLAKELASRADEAALRSAASRAYYAVFCKARNNLRREGATIPRFSPHDLVWDTYAAASEPERVSVRRTSAPELYIARTLPLLALSWTPTL